MGHTLTVGMISVSEAAGRLGVTDGRVRALIYAKRLPAVKLIGTRVWLISEIDLRLVRNRKPGRPWSK